MLVIVMGYVWMIKITGIKQLLLSLEVVKVVSDGSLKLDGHVLLSKFI